MKTHGERLFATRTSLIERLVNWEDQRHWQEFFDAYWKLIYSVARKSGLSDDEAQEVVQETVITVAKNITKYERAAGSFKSWLMHTTRWRIMDQFRKRPPAAAPRPPDRSRSGTATIERVPAPNAVDDAWDAEWERHLFDAAAARVKGKVSAKQYQIFDCCMVKRWPAAKVAAELRVNITQVYVAKYRVSALLKKEIAALTER